ncbi:MAG: CPBP family intramembrane metalloprotease [Acidobacteria bacterium]|nr:MAG: CPBP family intramembrane metalloprotease [Acidobacteriota bacterium]
MRDVVSERGHRWLVAIPLAAIPLFGVLRTFHEHTPHVPGLGPTGGSLLLWAAVALAALHLVQRRRGLDLMPDIERGSGLTVGMIVPLLVVVVVEKWISAEIVPLLLVRVPLPDAPPRLADAAYRLAGGLALGAVTLMLWRVPRQIARKLEQRTLPERIPVAAGLVLGAAAVTGVVFAGLPAVAGDLRLAVAGPDPRTWATAFAAQIVRGAAEEFYFRGLLQTTLLRLLWQAGLPQGRLARVLAIGTVSIGFAVEHVDPASPLAAQG